MRLGSVLRTFHFPSLVSAYQGSYMLYTQICSLGAKGQMRAHCAISELTTYNVKDTATHGASFCGPCTIVFETS